MTEAASTVRGELRRLILDGLAGRSRRTLFNQLVQAFEGAGEDISYETFRSWVEGDRFPANRKRQELLALVVGGPCGEAIRKLPSPAFRGWRRRIMRETEDHMVTHAQGAREWRAMRKFPTLSVRGDDGRTHLRPVIQCAICHTRETAVRNGSINDDELFIKKGWEVGRSNAFDYCPSCIREREAKKKVVKMEDHVKKNDTAASSTVMSKEEGRILSRLIEDRWDEAGGRYRPGWSDAKLAAEVGKPIEWVKERRELDFGGTGEDPGLVDFIAEQVKLNTEMAGLRSLMEELAGSVSELGSQHDKVQRLLEKYRDGHNALATKATRLQEVAKGLSGPFERKAG